MILRDSQVASACSIAAVAKQAFGLPESKAKLANTLEKALSSLALM